MRAAADGEARSNTSASASMEWDRLSSFARLSSLSLDLATRITFCPRAASARAKTSPNPWDAPVTRAKLESFIFAQPGAQGAYSKTLPAQLLLDIRTKRKETRFHAYPSAAYQPVAALTESICLPSTIFVSLYQDRESNSGTCSDNNVGRPSV